MTGIVHTVLATVPTGSITFLDGATNLSTIALAGGQSQFFTPLLSFGNHTIGAQYGGDANYLPSSGTYTQVIDTVPGSLDGNSTIDAADLVLLANYLAGNVAPGQGSFTAPLTAADLNLDGHVDAVDYQILSQYLVGNITTLPCTTCH